MSTAVQIQLTDAPKKANQYGMKGNFGSAAYVVSPQVAQHWLETTNVHNRPLNQLTVRELSRQITGGNWSLTHQGIAFDTTGMLVDGQHRLSAVVHSGQSVPMLISWGVNPDSFAKIDTGRRRTASDVLALSGFDLPNRNTVSAAARILEARKTLALGDVSNARMARTNQEILNLVSGMDTERLVEASRIGHRYREAGSTAVAAFVYDALGAGVSEDVITEGFLAPIARGLGLTSDTDPRWAARKFIERLTKTRRSGSAPGRAQAYTVLCLAFNEWVSQTDRKFYRDQSDWVAVQPLPSVFSY